jgi:thymidylate kinase
MAKRDHRLAHVVDAAPLLKNSDQNFYLRKAFEQRDHRFFFHFQIDSLSSRFWNTMAAPVNALVDETIYTTLAYSRALLRLGWIAEYEYKAFYAHYRLYNALMPKPTKLYYFSCNENILISRLQARGKKKHRSHEAYYLPEYVDALSYAFAELSRELSNTYGLSVVCIDSTARSSDEIATTYAPEHLD